MKDLRVSAHDVKQFARAAEIARWGEHHRVRVGAILAHGRTALAKHHNRIASWDDGEPFKKGHAERMAIEGVPAIKGTLYVARLDLNDSLVASWPCGECMAHIIACACVSKIVYHNGTEIKKVRL